MKPLGEYIIARVTDRDGKTNYLFCRVMAKHGSKIYIDVREGQCDPCTANINEKQVVIRNADENQYAQLMKLVDNFGRDFDNLIKMHNLILREFVEVAQEFSDHPEVDSIRAHVRDIRGSA